MEQRLQAVLSGRGVGSRRYCEGLVAAGRVAVNGVVFDELGSKADPEKDVVTLDGKPLPTNPKKVYFLLNKPVGYASTRRDPHASRTVIDLIKGYDGYLYPAGRLDMDTSGLLILTNDGDLAHLITHPSHTIEKTYEVVVEGKIGEHHLGRLEKGVSLAEGSTAPARASLLGYYRTDNKSRVELTISEGKKRQVRRMFEVLGHPVVELCRTRIAELTLGNLRPGDFRKLTATEVADLRATAEKPRGRGTFAGRPNRRRG